eukprot:XP_001702134.1 flagellar associated protein [Chlamydomonas reinhardtii]
MEVEEPGESFAYSEANGRPRYVPPSESGLPDDDASIAFSDAGLSDKPPASKPRSAAPSGGSGGPVFKRVPANAPDSPSASVTSSPAAAPAAKPRPSSSRASSRAESQPAAPASASGADSFEGAIRGSQVEALIRKHPATWDALDVANWVDFIGLGQYRRRFLHHCVDGRMLLRIKDAQLKSELSIGPMGHRAAVLEAAAQLGKQTVYEQRARLLFELDRAQARAEQHRALAEQLKHTANLSSDEVAHLRGLLADIEAKNRTAFGTSGAVDSSARIPWRHVGPGTRHNNWASERFARPGDPETVDMTFQPRISKESKKIMGGGEYGEGSGGANNFLDRLNNDLRKRQTNRKELERRYYSEGAGAGSPAQAEADWQVVAEGLQSRCHVALDRDDPAGTEELIDEAVDKLSTGESWREAGCRAGPIRAAKGPGKVAAMAQALRSLAFMERYKSDLKQKNGKMKALETKWLHQTLGAQYLPGAKDKEDLTQAVGFFALLGWRGHDGGPSEEAVTEDLLDRLLDRAIEYRIRYDAWWDRVRERPEERAAGFVCDVDWRNEPRWAADGLGSMMSREMDRHQRGVDNDASGQPDAPGQMDFVDFTVQLLGKSRLDDLRRLRGSSAGSAEGGGLSERGKRLAVYRAIRTQKFIEFTQKDLEERERKLRQAYTALAPPKRVLQSSRIEGFFERLMEDASKRRAKADKLAHDKVAKEKEILASSVMYGRPRSAR